MLQKNTTIKYYNSIKDLPISHHQLFAAYEHDSFDLSADWFKLLEDSSIFPAVIPSYFCHEEKGQATCIIPLNKQLYQNKIHQLAGLSNFYTSLYRPLISQSTSSKELGAALAFAFEKIKIDQAYFPAMDPQHHSYTLLENALRLTKLRPFRFYCFGNWYLPVNGRSYEDYFKGLSSQTRNTIKRRCKKFLANNHGRLEIITDGDQLENAIQIWVNIYNKSWKRPEPYPNFMPAFIRMLASRGWLRLGIAYYKEHPVATQLWIISYGRAAIYKLAYDEAFSQLSPGTVLTDHLMRYALDVDKVNEVDYLVGDDAYKKDWMSHRRERWGIIAFNPYTVAGLYGYIRQLAAQTYKRYFKKTNTPQT